MKYINNYFAFLSCTFLFIVINTYISFGQNRQGYSSLYDSATYYEVKGWENYISGNYELAESLYIRSGNFYKEIKPLPASNIANDYLNLGVQCKKQWKYSQALEFYKDAIDIFTKYQDTVNMANAYMNIGNILKNEGDFKNAEAYYINSINLIRNSGNIDYLALSKAYNNIGSLYYELGEYAKAIMYLNRSIELKETCDVKALSIPLFNLAILYYDRSEFDKALYYHDLALESKKMFSGQDHISLGENYLHKGKLYIAMGNDSEGLRYLNKALSVYSRVNGVYHPAAYNCFIQIGNYYQGKGDYFTAMENYQQAIIVLSEDFADQDIYKYPDTDDTYSKIKLLEAVKLKAIAFYEYAQHNGSIRELEASMEGFDLAIALIDKIRGEYMSHESKLILAEHQSETFSWALKAAYTMWEKTNEDIYKQKLFAIAEKGKSAVLMDALRNNEADEFGGVPQGLLEKEDEIKRGIACYSEYLHEEKRQKAPDSAKISLWEEKLFRLNRDYDALINLFNSEYPGYYQLKYKPDEVLVTDIQANLNPGTAIIEYALEDSLLYILLITKNLFNIYCTRIDSSFYDQLNLVNRHVGNTEYSKTNGDEFMHFVASAALLYDKLLSPFQDYIKGKKIVIIPDKDLSYLPFEILLTHAPDGMTVPDYRHLPYLIRENTISYAFNVSSLHERKMEKQENNNKLLAFVPEYKGSNLEAGTLRSYRKEYLDRLSPLPFARKEVEHIQGIIKGTDVFIGDQATESNFKQNAGSYRVLHLAMHTILNDEDPMFSKLAFEAYSDSLDDGFLNTFEIFNLKLDACLVVLSSCNSGSGTLRKGEGLMSLARGFAFAGCPGIVMTLWEVDDEAGVNIMSGFYKYLKKGNSIDDALRFAKLDYLDKADIPHSHPFLWASYVDIGQTTPVFKRINNRWYIYSLILIIALSCFFYFRVKRLRS